ncbi:8-oxo-dGTP diphosphatase [Archangium gephyra]|uniref:8-oxo-dGTP diphosphatase n=1 Tax=Archangium gephyra TaxID=48 RepID=A0AAC8Q226_9BACT|nr:NUDIX domain-containing protein [Archangium gephyra]AKI99425.1 NTP pyrophosphohydrolase including oxidative damage repair enzymes [Archangium gephyra]REG28028.1 8-oxo-dGTP diphosphatase [Archangium gephyra]
MRPPGPRTSIPQFGKRVPGRAYIERPGAYAVIVNTRGEVALIRVPQGYFLPGGGIDPHEDALSALAREVREETGHEVQVVRELGWAAQFLMARHEELYLNKVGQFFVARLGPKTQEAHEVDHSLEWLPLAEAKKRLRHEFQAWALEQFELAKDT